MKVEIADCDRIVLNQYVCTQCGAVVMLSSEPIFQCKTCDNANWYSHPDLGFEFIKVTHLVPDGNEIEFDRAKYRSQIEGLHLSYDQLLDTLVREAAIRYKYQTIAMDDGS